ncbi:apolipoprotein N-acyltransferase [Legionella waltersii]|uniref:Apolipoprotein N-acyltransferase n=1 Tax=Legionella waltersii TaxID=66969 RepID=A0A0W1ALW2_9GAMM|nr:apolipoprotein N-acyltransferase [Legionella waltersii]KTD82347.1 apolipoprotein N-acyltransferase [Legionella waltersii]SNV03913.1 apolipoprotein N-acyltransferase [Legionella waltersii]
MTQTAVSTSYAHKTVIRSGLLNYLFLSGLLSALGFAPFHLPGLTILSLAFLFATLLSSNTKQAVMNGLFFGLGYFGFGVSWVIVSIHDYGGLNYLASGFITLLFITYLSFYPACVSFLFKRLSVNAAPIVSMLLFSVLWCCSEWLRSNLFTGFPWLIIGTTQIDTPLRSLAPIFGLSGLSLLCCFAATLLCYAIKENSTKRYIYLCLFVLILIAPSALKNIQWTQVKNNPISVGVIQPNLSMRDKWDEALFWNLLKFYENTTNHLLGTHLIILPESAIPLPASYLEDYLAKMNYRAIKSKSSILLGILKPANSEQSSFYNSIISLGKARGEYLKRQLVPFGEYIPQPFVSINRWLNLPEPNIVKGQASQPLIHVGPHPIASLICYEIAYPKIIRKQLPLAQWIVSISDNGWFGKSLASYQQLQMAQMLSLLSGRYQVVVNNDGLSSVINNQGAIVDSLPAFHSGILKATIYPYVGSTPWTIWNETPSYVFCSFFLVFILFLHFKALTKK